MCHDRLANDTGTCQDLKHRFLSAWRKHARRASGVSDSLEETMTSLSGSSRRHRFPVDFGLIPAGEEGTGAASDIDVTNPNHLSVGPAYRPNQGA